MTSREPVQNTLGVILAAGFSRRFGSNKSLVLLDGRQLIAHVIERAAPQVGRLLLNSNEGSVFASLQIEILPDEAPGEGPLAGILAGIAFAQDHGLAQVASFSCDTPFIPNDLVTRLSAALCAGGDYALARAGQAEHPILALWPVACRTRLAEAFENGARSMRDIRSALVPAFADFPVLGAGPQGDSFFNINTKSDLDVAQAWLAGH